MNAIGRCCSNLLVESKEVAFEFEALDILLEMPLDWKSCGSVVSQRAQQLIGKRTLEELLPLVRKAGKSKAGSLGECLATSAMMKTFGAQPVAALDACDAMVS